jgi:hypothetical protein
MSEMKLWKLKIKLLVNYMRIAFRNWQLFIQHPQHISACEFGKLVPGQMVRFNFAIHTCYCEAAYPIPLQPMIYHGHIVFEKKLIDVFELVVPFYCEYCGRLTKQIFKPCEIGNPWDLSQEEILDYLNKKNAN